MATVAAVVVAAAATLPEWGFIILTHAPRNLRTVTKLDVPRLAAVGGGGGGAAARGAASISGIAVSALTSDVTNLGSYI